MAKFQLNDNEAMIGSGQVALHQKQFLNTKPFSGNIYFTNQRACFYISIENYVFTGFPVKKLQDWLRQAGVREL